MHTVMIAEDELLVRMGLSSTVPWEELGLKVVAAVEDGARAWEAYNELKPDILLTDLRMPGMDGAELIERIRQVDQRCQIIVVTCIEDFEVLYKLMQLQVTGYLLKATMAQDDIEKQLKLAVRNLSGKDLGETVVQSGAGKVSAFPAFILEHRDIERFRTECRQHGTAPRMPEIGLILQINPEGQPAVLLSSIQNIFLERIASLGDCESFFEQNEIFFFLMDDIGRRSTELISLIRELIQYGRDILNVQLRGVLCRIDRDEEKLFPLINASRAVLQNSYFFPAELNSVDSEDIVMPQALTEQIALFQEKVHLTPWKLPQQKKSFCAHLQKLYDFPVESGVFCQTVIALAEEYSACSAEEGTRNHEDLLAAIRTAPSAGEALRILSQELCCASVSPHPLYGKKIMKTMHFIREHLAENLSLSQMADMVALSPNYYASLFKQTAGCSFSEYVGSVRIEKACELLSGSALSIQKISSLCGFSDTAYFTRYFKQKVGIPPHQWRTKQ